MSKTTATSTAKPPVGFRDFERNNDDVKKVENIKMPLHRITVRKGFNPRDLDKPETQTKIKGLQASYEAGQHVPMILVRMGHDGETVEIVDGECRYTAAVRADKAMRDRGEAGIEFFECEKFTGTDIQAVTYAFKSAQGENLLPLEQSNSVRDLQAMGLKREEVAVELDKSIGWIDRLIVIAKLPDNIKGLVKEGKVAAELAVKYVKKHGDGAYQAILDDIAAAAKKGESKVTPRHAKEPEGDDDADPAEDQEEAERKKAEAKAAKKAEEFERKRLAQQHLTARELALALPDKITKTRNIQPEQEYDIKLTGSAIKLLMALQDRFSNEITDAFKASKAAAE